MKALQQSGSSRLLVLVLALLSIALLFWANLQFAQNNPGGNDFLPRWLASRLYITEQQNPYSAETTLAIQERMYGRPAWPTEDQALFAYPFYAVFLVSPFALIEDFAIARAIWMAVLEISLLLVAFLGMRMAKWSPDRFALLAFLLFSILWYHGAKPLVDGNMSIVVALFLSSALWALQNTKDTLAGFLLALSTTKPQMAILIVPFVLIWAVSQRRWRVVKSFSLSMFTLLALSFALLPQWLFENLVQVATYPFYVPPGNPATIFSNWWPDGGAEWGWALSGLLFLLLLYEWWKAMGKPIQHFLWAALLTLVLSPFIGIPSTTSNFVAMLLVFPFTFKAWSRRVGVQNSRIEIGMLMAIFFGLWILYTSTLLPSFQYREHLVMFFSLPLLLLVNLYWLRWWIISPAQLTYPGKNLREEGQNY